MNNYLPLSRKADILEQNLLEEVLIFDLEKHRAFSLNPSLANVWKMCDGTNTVAEITKEISKKFDSPVTEEFVWLALDQLERENLLENTDFHLRRMSGLSRREIVKRAGLASMIALPLLSALFVPTAAHAASTCVPLNGACIQGVTVCCPGLNCLYNLPLNNFTCR